MISAHGSRRTPRRPYVALRWAILFTVNLIGAQACVAQSQAELDQALRDKLLSGALKGTLVSRVEKEVWQGQEPGQSVTIYRLGGFELQLADLGDQTGIVGVLENGRVVYVGQTVGSAPTLMYDLALGIDADQDGAPDTAIATYSGGAHCCTTYQVVNFGETFRAGAVLDGGSGGIALENASPTAVFRGHDGVLEYWHASFAESIFPDVLFSLDHDRVVLADAWMRRQPPTPEEREQFAARLPAAFASPDGWMRDPQDDEPPFAPRVLIERMVSLIYSGNGEAAITLLRDSWVGDPARREAVALDLLTRLATSSYWDGLKALNGWSGEPREILAGP